MIFLTIIAMIASFMIGVGVGKMIKKTKAKQTKKAEIPQAQVFTPPSDTVTPDIIAAISAAVTEYQKDTLVPG